MNRVMVAVMLACSVDAATVTAAEVRFVDEAKVVSIEEITKTIKVRKPSESCWQERVSVSQPKDDSATSEILGGVLGGVVGNQFGDGAGKSLMTGAGVLLGASLGNDHDRESAAVEYKEVERCKTEESVTTKVIRDYYRVVLDYNGKEMVTVMENLPADDTVDIYVTASTENQLPVSRITEVKNSTYRDRPFRSHRRGPPPRW